MAVWSDQPRYVACVSTTDCIVKRLVQRCRVERRAVGGGQGPLRLPVSLRVRGRKGSGVKGGRTPVA